MLQNASCVRKNWPSVDDDDGTRFFERIAVELTTCASVIVVPSSPSGQMCAAREAPHRLVFLGSCHVLACSMHARLQNHALDKRQIQSRTDVQCMPWCVSRFQCFCCCSESCCSMPWCVTETSSDVKLKLGGDGHGTLRQGNHQSK